MRKNAILIAALFCAGIAAAPAALADSLTLTVQNTTPSTTTFVLSGTYASGVPSTSISSPGQNYTISFTIQTDPGSLGSFVAGGSDAFAVNTDLAISVTGLPSVAFLGVQMAFYDTLNGNDGGLAFCTDNSCANEWIIGGSQLFNGTVSNPSSLAFTSGSAAIDSMLSGYYINNQGPFPLGPAQGTTPEPASLLTMATGLIGLGAFVRRKLL
ncbi:MAG TPA: PEP-CTERM sorting domain-containing protein [Candidatus Acidoferrales bacterium]|nr:PEP-CTERM sorting domain-containing protein [Candidatus Acidoferrales bacterium]